MVKKGIAYSLLSAVIFGAMPLMTKILYTFGMDFVSSAFYRMSLSLVFIYIINKFYFKEDMKLTLKEFKYILLAAICFASNSLFLFNSYNYINSGTATAIFFLNPIIIFTVLSIKYKQKPAKIDIICITGALTGLFLCMDIEEMSSITGALIALMSAFAFSIYTIVVGKEELKEIGAFKLLFYINFIGAITILIYAFAFAKGIYTDYTPNQIPALFLYSAIISMGATYYYQRGVAYIGAKNTSLLCTLELLVSVLISFYIIGEPVRKIEIFAALLIFFCSFFLVKNSKE
ncbi:integral membrane protein [Peptoniphilus sp. ING2-D1G]|nr:integral membrane protein [Peptoniphilus sp. ING2-D1G]